MRLKKMTPTKPLRLCIFTTALLIFSSMVFADWPHPGHPANRVGGGTFNGSFGDFTFPSNVDVYVAGDTLYIGGSALTNDNGELSWEGSNFTNIWNKSGTVVCIKGSGKMGYCDIDYDTSVAGIISTEPGVHLNSKCEGDNSIPIYDSEGGIHAYEDDPSACDGWAPIALKGKVPTKVRCENPIKPGDILVAGKEGFAIKPNESADSNIIILTKVGRALEHCNSGEGFIEVWI